MRAVGNGVSVVPWPVGGNRKRASRPPFPWSDRTGRPPGPVRQLNLSVSWPRVGGDWGTCVLAMRSRALS